MEFLIDQIASLNGYGYFAQICADLEKSLQRLITVPVVAEFLLV